MAISKIHVELMKKIIEAKLTKDELQQLTAKATEIINRRPATEEETESDEIIKEALSN